MYGRFRYSYGLKGLPTKSRVTTGFSVKSRDEGVLPKMKTLTTSGDVEGRV